MNLLEEQFIENLIIEHLKILNLVKSDYISEIKLISEEISEAVKNKSTIFFCGNGGSAADSQHLSAELIGRFEKERKPLKAIALTVDSSILTCISNDYSFDQIFSRQIEALAKPNDILVALSTSGKSMNIINAVNMAKSKGLKTIALLGKDGGLVKNIVDIKIIIPSYSTARIQEMHILIGHIICSVVDKEIC